MENEVLGSDRGKKTLQKDSDDHISMSDTESTASQVDSFHSPIRTESPLRFDDPYFQTENDRLAAKNNCKAIVPIVEYHSPIPSPGKSVNPASSEVLGGKGRVPLTHSGNPTNDNLQFRSGSPPAGENRRGQHIPSQKSIPENIDFQAEGMPPSVVGLNKIVREQGRSDVKKVEPVGGVGLEEGKVSRSDGEVGGNRKSRTAAVSSILRRSEMNAAVTRAALGLRIFESIACLISFSVMAADRTQGWSGDSFDRYTEYRFCLAINIIGCVYSGFQAYDMAYNVGTGKHVIPPHLHFYFSFSMDQLLAYLLMSASSAAATRVDDWITNWGGDKFTLMACASIAMSFLAFVAFSLSSLISGYNLCIRN